MTGTFTELARAVADAAAADGKPQPADDCPTCQGLGVVRGQGDVIVICPAGHEETPPEGLLDRILEVIRGAA